MIVMYHNIGEEAGFNTVSVSKLEEQLIYLKNNYEIVDIDTYIRSFDNKKAVISVDDGYVSFRDLFLPLTDKMNIPSLLFIPTDHIGKYNSWDTEKKIDIMSEEQIREISYKSSVTIGSHGTSHRRMSHLKKEEIDKELSESKHKLEEITSRDIKHFSYPFGQLNDLNNDTKDILKKNGYESACSTRHGIKNSKNNIYSLYRVEAEPCDTLNSFRAKCENPFHIKLIKRYIKECLIKTGVYRK